MPRFGLVLDLPEEMLNAMRERSTTDWRRVAERAFAAELAKPPRDVLLVASQKPTHHRRAALARSEKLTPERRSEIAREAAEKRWRRKKP